MKDLHHGKESKKYVRANAKKVVEALLLWIFNNFIIPLMRHTFYATERHNEFNKLFYYRYEAHCFL